MIVDSPCELFLFGVSRHSFLILSKRVQLTRFCTMNSSPVLLKCVSTSFLYSRMAFLMAFLVSFLFSALVFFISRFDVGVLASSVCTEIPNFFVLPYVRFVFQLDWV